MRTGTFFLSFFFIFSPFISYAEWNPVLKCEESQMVVDHSEAGYQLVVRNPDAIRYFQSRLPIRGFLNGQGELVIPLTLGGPQIEGTRALFVGNLGGPVNVVVSKSGSNTYRVSVWRAGYRGTHNEEMGSWEFFDCSS